MAFARQPVFALSLYLHAMTFVFLGMFVAASSGEVLFNKEEGDILLHRPIEPKVLLRAKIRVIVEVSLWLAAAFNLAGFFVGMAVPDGGWRFPLAHALSTCLEALFCAGFVVLGYQLCLRWFGRERLDSLMTGAQMAVAIGAVLAGQIVPRVMFHIEGVSRLSPKTWWVCLLPPAWFAGLDDALAGGSSAGSWLLGGLSIAAAGAVCWLALGKLAGDYEKGLQTLGETAAPVKNRRGRRLLDKLVAAPPLNWLLRDPVTRASFLLTAACLARDRDVKLRVFPGLAPLLIMPLVFLFENRGGGNEFNLAFASGFLSVIPLSALNFLQYSQQWQASDIFRVAPLNGPARICDGARWAVLIFLTLPLAVVFALLMSFAPGHPEYFLLTIPGLLLLPVSSLIPALAGTIPLSVAPEEAKSANRGVMMVLAMFGAMALSGLAIAAWHFHWFAWFVAVEAVVCTVLYFVLRSRCANVPWPPID